MKKRKQKIKTNNSKNHCIYLAVHKVTGLEYIGQRNKPDNPRHHKIKDIHTEKMLSKDDFNWLVIHQRLTQKQANDLEVAEIAKHRCLWPNGYNRTKGGKTECEVSEVTKAKMSKNNAMKRPEVAAKISVVQKGKKHSLEHCKKISKTMTGRKLSLKTRKKMSKAMKGKLKPGTSKAMTKNNPMKRPEIAAKHGKTQIGNQHVKGKHWKLSVKSCERIAEGMMKAAAKRRGLTVEQYIKQRDKAKLVKLQQKIEKIKVKLAKLETQEHKNLSAKYNIDIGRPKKNVLISTLL